MSISKDQILERLTTVDDPRGGGDLVSANAVKAVAVCDGVVSVTIQGVDNPSLRQRIKIDTEAAVRSLGDEVNQVTVEFAAAPGSAAAHGSSPTPGSSPTSSAPGSSPTGSAQSPQDAARAHNPLPGVKHVIAVGAGKGGVGKSTVAVNLAVGLARAGCDVGLMDGDIYGPSIPTMLGTDRVEPKVEGNRFIPFDLHGIKSMTMGALVDDDRPLIWRGPMAHRAFGQIAQQTNWGDLEYLIIDLPPGTGDVPLTMAQMLPLRGAVVVCTPQKVAQDDARRAIAMFRQLGIEVLGVVENMSYFIGDDGKEYDIFGRGGAEMMAQQTGCPFLGRVPIHMRLRHNCDAGNPTANFTDDDALAKDLTALVNALRNQVAVAELGAQQPTISVS